MHFVDSFYLSNRLFLVIVLISLIQIRPFSFAWYFDESWCYSNGYYAQMISNSSDYLRFDIIQVLNLVLQSYVGVNLLIQLFDNFKPSRDQEPRILGFREYCFWCLWSEMNGYWKYIFQNWFYCNSFSHKQL